jgi:hypothetical protein
MVSAYCDRFYANKPKLAARRIEAIGFQVGLQLSERYTSTHTVSKLMKHIFVFFSFLDLGLYSYLKSGL